MNPITYPEIPDIQTIVDNAQRIVIIQADNPDADSLGSALALEQILGDLGKEPLLYCGVDIPGYLRYLEGWDRVSRDMPHRFDASIIVDASTVTLLEKIQQSGYMPWLASKPCIILDHHAEVQNLIPFATVTINDAGRSSTGELIYAVSQQLNWPLNTEAQAHAMTAILGDTQGLSNQLTGAATYRIMAEMTDAGVNRPTLEEARREASKMPPEIFRYKADLIQRTELLAGGRLAVVTIPQSEITEFSPLYNPAPLVQGDMLQTAGVQVSVVLKQYDDGKATAAIRCNAGAPVGAELATHFGGGGHPYASGFKIAPGPASKPFNEVKSECISYATILLDTLADKQRQAEQGLHDDNDKANGPEHETLQHAQQTS
jgi:phosphoesterase RecJ-like protein